MVKIGSINLKRGKIFLNLINIKIQVMWEMLFYQYKRKKYISYEGKG
jgi:hypothetical protein